MNADVSLVAVVVLGLTYAALPGVVNTEAFRRGVSAGFGSAVQIQTGALIGDALWAAIALSGAALLLQHDVVALALGIAGAGYLFYLARTALISAWRGTSMYEGQIRSGGSFLTGVIFSLANPAGLAFWTGIGGGMLGASGGATAGDAAAFLAAFLLGVLAWGVGMSALVAWGRRFVSPRIFRAIDALCGLALAVFGLRLLWTTLQRYNRLIALLPRALA